MAGGGAFPSVAERVSHPLTSVASHPLTSVAERVSHPFTAWQVGGKKAKGSFTPFHCVAGGRRAEVVSILGHGSGILFQPLVCRSRTRVIAPRIFHPDHRPCILHPGHHPPYLTAHAPGLSRAQSRAGSHSCTQAAHAPRVIQPVSLNPAHRFNTLSPLRCEATCARHSFDLHLFDHSFDHSFGHSFDLQLGYA